MNSNKQRRKQIMSKRRERVKSLRQQRAQNAIDVNVYEMPETLPPSAVRSNPSELAHNNTYSSLPLFYVDRSYICRDCGAHDVWKAKQQKWWYEVAKGHIDSRAVQCLLCRKMDQAKREDQKRHMKIMAEKKPHPNEQFFQKK